MTHYPDPEKDPKTEHSQNDPSSTRGVYGTLIGGLQDRPQNVIILFMGTPQEGTEKLIFPFCLGQGPWLSQRAGTGNKPQCTPGTWGTMLHEEGNWRSSLTRGVVLPRPPQTRTLLPSYAPYRVLTVGLGSPKFPLLNPLPNQNFRV